MLPQEPQQITEEKTKRQIPLDIRPEVMRQIALSPRGGQTHKVSAADLEQRVQKAHFALGADSPGVDALYVDFERNLERETRRQAAAGVAMQNKNTRLAMVKDLMQLAQEEGREMSPLEQDVIMGLSAEEIINPQTILEKLYAEKLIRTGVSTQDPEEDQTLQDAMEEDEEAAQQVLDEGEDTVTRQELALHHRAQLKKRYDDSSWGRWGVDVATTVLFPLVTHFNLTDVETSIPNGSTLTGDQVRELLIRTRSLPVEEYDAEVGRILDEMYEDNIIDAMYMAEAFVGYSNTEQQFDNDMFKFDVADVLSLGTLPVLKGVARLARRVRNISRANSPGDIRIEDGLAAAGNIEDAAVESATRRITTVAPEGRVMESIAELGKSMPWILDANSIVRNAGTVSQEAARRIVHHVQKNRELLMQTMTDATVLQRYSQAAGDAAIDATIREFKRDHYKIEDAIVEIVPVRESQHTFGGVDRIDVLMGRLDATSFPDVEAADLYARQVLRLPKGGFDVVDYKGNYLIRKFKHVNETESGVIDIRMQTDAPDTPTFIGAYINGFREKTKPLGKLLSPVASPDDIFDAGHSAARKVATYGVNRVAGLMAQSSKKIGKLSGKERTRLKTVLERNHFEMRTVRHPDGTVTKEQGNRYYTLGEIQRGWRKHTGKMPTEKEIMAYLDFNDIMDQELKVNNAAKYRDKARLGIEQKAISFVMEVDGKPTRMTSPFFEGRTVDSLPSWDKQPFTVAWQDPKKGKIRFKLSSRMHKGERDALEAMMAKGNYRVIQTLEGGGPLQKVIKSGGEPIDYVISRDISSKPLEFQQIAYNPGGHRRYADFGAYMKQPNVTFTSQGRVVRSGDTTAHWDPSIESLKKHTEKYETARKMLLDGTSKRALNTYVKQNLPWYKSGADFRKHFRGLEGSPKDAPFDARSPFVVVRSRQNTGDVIDLPGHFGQDYLDRAQSEHNLGNKIGSYMGQERNELLTRIRQEGSETDPVFKLEPAQIMDPMSSLDRSVQQLVHSRYFDDYKHMAAETWAERAIPFLDNATPSEVRANPMKYLMDPVWKKGPFSAERVWVQSQARAIKQIMGAESDTWGPINTGIQALADQIAKRAGKPTTEIVDAWRWQDPNLTPHEWARSAAFHGWLGLGNVKHLLLQGQAVMNIYAITGNPIRSSQAVHAYMMMRRLLLTNGNKVGPASKMVNKALGIPEELFQEMFETYRRAGLHEFQGENAQLDIFYKPSMMTSPIRKGLDVGQFFFREGNLISRGSSYAAAFLEYRAKNPTKKINDADLAKIIERADIMSANQTRASINPIYEQGWMKYPFQFFTFFNRMSDQMIGHRLTPMEKARLMTVYSIVYGVPTGTAGLALGRFWPFHESVRQEATGRGFIAEDHPVVNFLLEGGLPMLVEAWTEEDMDATGSWGPGGLPWLRDFYMGHKGALETLAGASGQFYGELIRAAQPFAMYLADIFAPSDVDSDTFKLKEDDFLRILRTVSSVNAAAGIYMAWQHNSSFTRGGKYVGPNTVEIATLSALTGWPQQRVTEYYDMIQLSKEDEAHKAALTAMALEEFKKGIWALENEGDEATFHDYSMRARIILQNSGLNAVQAMRVFERALSANREPIEDLEANFPFKGPNDQWEDRHRKAYRRVEQEFMEMETE
jgi:hypothetical protein